MDDVYLKYQVVVEVVTLTNAFMKTSTLAISLSMLFLLSCSDEPEDKIGPVKNEQWFKDLQAPCEPDDICKTAIGRGIYVDQTVYFVELYGGLCDAFGVSRIYNDKGEIVKEYDMDTWFHFYEDVTDTETIWTCD